jgi:hypothetical protein
MHAYWSALRWAPARGCGRSWRMRRVGWRMDTFVSLSQSVSASRASDDDSRRSARGPDRARDRVQLENLGGQQSQAPVGAAGARQNRQTHTVVHPLCLPFSAAAPTSQGTYAQSRRESGQWAASRRGDRQTPAPTRAAQPCRRIRVDTGSVGRTTTPGPRRVPLAAPMSHGGPGPRLAPNTTKIRRVRQSRYHCTASGSLAA